VPFERLAAKHPHVVDDEHVVDGLRFLAPPLLAFARLPGAILVCFFRQPAQVLLRFLLPHAILLLELRRRYR
jgi:hypothetical protein